VVSYDDFYTLRTTVCERLKRGTWGSRYPTLMGHSDSHGVWSPEDAERLTAELVDVRNAFASLSSMGVIGEWQAEAAKNLRLIRANLADCFVDVDGEPLLDRLIALARTSVAGSRPIWFE